MPIKIGGNASRTPDNYQGLYDMAYDSGLKDKADTILARNSGEQSNQIFSGGTFSDIFDALSLDSYGMVGLLKGKGFAEGIKNRESFSDNDALGQYGLAGGIAGMIADIAVSPTTYLAPFSILKKVPGVMHLASGIKSKLVGNMVERATAEGKTVMERVGGVNFLNFAADKLVYHNSFDPRMAEFHNQYLRDTAISHSEVTRLTKPLAQLDDTVGKSLLARDEHNNFIRKSLDQIQNETDAETFAKVKPVWDTIDAKGKELVDLGVLDKSTYEAGLGNYIKNAYAEHEAAKTSNFGKGGFFGIGKTKARMNLDLEARQQLGEIDKPGYLAGVTLLKMDKDIISAKFQKQVKDMFATDTAFEGAKQIPVTSKWQTNRAVVADTASKIKQVNEQIAPSLKAMQKAFKGDREMTATLKQLEKDLGKYQAKGQKELGKLYNIINDVPDPGLPVAGKTAKLVENNPIILKSAAKARKEVLTTELEQMKKQARDFRVGYKQGGMAVKTTIKESQDAFIKVLKDNFEGASLKRMIGRISKVTTPDKLEKAIDEAISIASGVQKKAKLAEAKDIHAGLTKLAKQAQAIAAKSDKVKGAKNANMSKLVKLEEQINNLRFNKEDLLQQIKIDKNGALAGKFVPESIHNILTEVSDMEKSGLGGTIIAGFKFSKIVLSPAAHVRGIMGNMILNHWRLGIGPWRVDKYLGAAIELKKGSPMVERARKMGLGASTMASQEIYQLLDDPQAGSMAKRLGGKFTRLKNFLGSVYGFEEEMAKFVAFKHNVGKGMTDLEAWKKAEDATYNYAQVTPFVRKMRTSLFGAPFITFALKSLPSFTETALHNPQRIAAWGKIRTMLQEQGVDFGSEEELNSMPDYMKNGFYLRLPGKDEYGRAKYFDLTYSMPMSQIVTLTSDAIAMATGNKPSGDAGSGLAAGGVSLIPVLQSWKELSSNKNFVGQSIYRESDSTEEQVADIAAYLTKLYAPPIISSNISAGYNPNDMTQKAPVGLFRSLRMGGDFKDTQTKTVMQELGSYGAFTVKPFNQEVQQSTNEWNKKNDLEQLLVENGILKRFSSTYTPK